VACLAGHVSHAMQSLVRSLACSYRTRDDLVGGSHVAALLLRSKLYIPPVRPELVSRPRLVERLNAGLQNKLTLVSAPAGFGKTTLLSEWIASHGTGASSGSGPARDGPPAAIRFSWLSLDEGDNDPFRF
jgi:LuxR family maltose regulon positive regulatory protein